MRPTLLSLSSESGRADSPKHLNFLEQVSGFRFSWLSQSSLTWKTLWRLSFARIPPLWYLSQMHLEKTFNGSLRFANKNKVLMSTTTLKNEETRLPFAQNKNRHLRLSSSQSQHLLVRKFQRIQLMATVGKVSLAVSVYFFPLRDSSHQSCTIQHLVMWTCLSSLSPAEWVGSRCDSCEH